jgi:hypothetical protein
MEGKEGSCEGRKKEGSEGRENNREIEGGRKTMCI